MVKMYVNRASQIVPRISPFIKKGESILDIGSGTGVISRSLELKKDAKVTMVDVQFNEICQQLPVIIYDGKKLPFDDNQFDNSLLITVLHHADNPKKVLEEARRVTKGNIIVMEDVFTDIIGRTVTFIGDCLVNFEIHSPFKNHSKTDWIEIFEKLKLKVLHVEEFKLICVGFPFKLAIFVLTKR